MNFLQEGTPVTKRTSREFNTNKRKDVYILQICSSRQKTRKVTEKIW